MKFRQQSWTPYGKKANSVEINVKDNQNQTIDFFKLFKGKTRDIKRILKKIKEQYGFDLKYDEEIKNINESERSWIKKDLEW